MFFAAAQMPCNIHPVYDLVPIATPARVVRVDGKYRASAVLSFHVREVQRALIVTVETGVLDHVRGHQLIASRVARSSGGKVTANGATATQARAQLARAIRTLTADENSELTREERAYDTVTENGAAQSQAPSYGFPGGQDVQDPACTR